jgi:putative IMPACT (imprinted ancient) family translation regulator
MLPLVVLTLVAPAVFAVEIKKSRFIARASRANTRAEAAAFVAASQEAKANHNAWAFKMGQDYRFHDDGEVGGTAGRPILRAIERWGLDHVVVVVTRYFGGIKLGAGGLARAYGGTAAECLRLASTVEVQQRIRVRVEAAFALTGAVFSAIDKAGAERLGEEYRDDGIVLELAIDASALESFRMAIQDATRGGAVVTIDASGSQG